MSSSLNSEESTMKTNPVYKPAVGLALIGLFLMLMSMVPINATEYSERGVRFPDGYVPMWVDEGDTVSTLINTRQIIMITPKTHPELLLGHEAEKATYLEVKLGNGQTIQVFEPFEEFVERIRRSK
jgi:hypothetical protein